MKDNNPVGKLLTVVLVASWIPFATPDLATAAEDAPPGGSASYSCKGDGDATTAVTPVTFTLFNPPASLRPGDTATLSGNLRITLSDADAQKSKLMLAHNAKIDATDFNLAVKVAGKKIKLEPKSLTSTMRPVESPFTMSADLSFPDLTIPSSATGAVVIEMPATRTASTNLTAEPDQATFTVRLQQDSLLVHGRDFTCWTDTVGENATIARIPLDEPTDDPNGASEAHAPDTTTSTPEPAPAAPPADFPPPSTDPLAAGAPLPGPLPDMPPPAPAAASPATSLVASAAIPPETASADTFVPGWILALFIAVFPAAAVTYAVIQRRRLRSLNLKTAPR